MNVERGNLLMVLGLLFLTTTPSYDESWDYIFVNTLVHGFGAVLIFLGCDLRERYWRKEL